MHKSQDTSSNNNQEPLMHKGSLSKLIDTSSLSINTDFDPIFTAIHKDYTIYQTSPTAVNLNHNKSNQTVPFTLPAPLQDFIIYPLGEGALYMIILSENSTLLIFKVVHSEDDEISIKLVKEKQLGNGELAGYFGLTRLSEGFVVFAKKEFTICGLSESSFKAKTKTLPEISAGEFDITSYTVNKKRNEVIVYLSKKDEIKILLLLMSENNKLSKMEYMDIESSEKIKLHEPGEFLNLGLTEFGEGKTKESFIYLVSSQGEGDKNIKLQKFKATSRKRPKGRTKRILVFDSEKLLTLNDNYVCSFSNNKCLLWGYNDILVYDLTNEGQEFESYGKIKFADIEFDGKQNGVDLSFDWAEYMDDGCLLVRNSLLIGKVDFNKSNKQPKKKVTVNVEQIKSNNKEKKIKPSASRSEKAKDLKEHEQDAQTKKKKSVVKAKVEMNNKKDATNTRVSFADKNTTKSKIKAKPTEIKEKVTTVKKNDITVAANKPVPPKPTKAIKAVKKSTDNLDISIESVLGKVRKQQEDLKEIEEQLKQLLLNN